MLADAGVATPVALNLQYNPDHYGESSGDEYALVKSQLEESGLFAVNLQSTEWVTYAKDRTQDLYPAYQLGWFPDYSDADNYLSPFFATENFLGNHYDNPEVNQLIQDQAVEGGCRRASGADRGDPGEGCRGPVDTAVPAGLADRRDRR